MFWGCSSGRYGKSPGVSWEKDWGPITADSYQEHIVPVVCGWNRLHRDSRFVFMQDNASSQASAATIKEMKERGIRVLEWPPFSPDLNPIEAVWNPDEGLHGVIS